MRNGTGNGAGTGLLVLLNAALAYSYSTDEFTVTGGGSSTLRDYVSDAVGNASQDATTNGLYFPFYTVGSGQGQTGFINGTYAYTVADYPLSSSNYDLTATNIVQFPISIGVATLYDNITTFSAHSSLQLNASVAAEIFQGNITTWDNPAILELNPNLTALDPPLPAGQNITVIVRTDSSAASFVMSQWFNETSEGAWKLGVNTTIAWPEDLPNFIYTIGASNVSGLIQNHTYSIGILDAYSGKKLKLNDTALQNKNGTFLRYSKADFNFTNLDGDVITFPPATEDWSKFSLVGLGGNETWPVPTTAMAASNQDLRTAGDDGTAQKQLFGYLLGPAVASYAYAYQEYVLPPAFLNASIVAVDSILTNSDIEFYLPQQLPTLGEPYGVSFTF